MGEIQVSRARSSHLEKGLTPVALSRGGKRWVLTFMRLYMIQALRARQKQTYSEFSSFDITRVRRLIIRSLETGKILVFAQQPIPVVEHLLELLPDLKEGSLGQEIEEDSHRCRAAVLGSFPLPS